MAGLADEPRVGVHWRVVLVAPRTNPNAFFSWRALLADFYGFVRRRLTGQRRVRQVNLGDDPIVSLWPIEAGRGEAATLIFEVAGLVDAAEGDGFLVGDLAMNGALCLELPTGQLIWPIYTPRPPAFNAERR